MALRRWLAFSAALFGASLAACNGCRQGVGRTTDVRTQDAPPTVRLYVLSDVGAALEPCGCQKDMLGGIDRFGALVASESTRAPSAVVAVGPTMFANEHLDERRREQDLWKASAMAHGLRSSGLVAWTPGKNDWSAGLDQLTKLREETGAATLGANLSGPTAAGVVPSVTKTLGGVSVGFVGVSAPRTSKGAPDGLVIEEAAAAMSREARRLREGGARIVVGLAAIDRGAALRMAEATPELDVLAVGSNAVNGEEDNKPAPPRFVGPVLVVQPSNHVTRTAVVEFHVRGQGRFADGSGLERAEKATDLATQIDDLQKRIGVWESNPATSKADLDKQRARLTSMREQLQSLQAPPPEPRGDFVRYRLVDVRDSLGHEPSVAAALATYYRKVNDANRERYRDRRAPPPAAGEPWYVGSETCRTCHAAAYDVWSKTQHAHAYATLSNQSKEFNLDCVGCHVTGYERPGGSTVTDVVSPNLQNVQCESCHGPGSAHLADPVAHQLTGSPSQEVCQGCHHPPHTTVFDFGARLPKVLGPGHGAAGAPAVQAAPPGWKPPPPRF